MPADALPPVSAAPRAAPSVPFAAFAALTWLNSLGSGVLWSGLYFVTVHDFGFTATANLWLSVAASAIYGGVALQSGRIVRWGRRRASTRTVLAALFAFETAASLLAFDGVVGVVANALCTSAFAALLWPIVESYLASGRHGPAMRTAIGRFNVVWMSATAASLPLMAPIVHGGSARFALAGYGAATLVSIVLLHWFPRDPAPHERADADAHVAPSYRDLRAATLWLMPVGYVFVGALGPLMPFFVARLGVEAQAETPLTSLWMVARLVAAFVMARIVFWHGRWSTLGVGAALLFVGFAATVLAPNVPVLAAGLLLLGAGQGIIYYASLYYAMAVGNAEVGAGGRFEALVGAGYLIGPLAALLGQSSDNGAATVACVSLTGLVTVVPVVRIWWRARWAG